MIGDGLAHVSFATIVIALLLSTSPILISIPLLIIASFIILKINEKVDINGDAAIGLVASFSIAVVVIIASVANGLNVDILSYLFRSILMIGNIDIIISIILSVCVIIILLYFYNSLFAIS